METHISNLKPRSWKLRGLQPVQDDIYLHYGSKINFILFSHVISMHITHDSQHPGSRVSQHRMSSKRWHKGGCLSQHHATWTAFRLSETPAITEREHSQIPISTVDSRCVLLGLQLLILTDRCRSILKELDDGSDDTNRA